MRCRSLCVCAMGQSEWGLMKLSRGVMGTEHKGHITL